MTIQYSWKWASSVSHEEFSSHFNTHRDTLLKHLSNECKEDANKTLNQFAENILTQIGNQSLTKEDNAEAILKFLKSFSKWEGKRHWHVNSLSQFYFKAVVHGNAELITKTSKLMHSSMHSLVKNHPIPYQSSEDKLLMLLCAKGMLDAIQQLVQKGVNVNTCDPLGITPLQIACIKGHHEVVEFLLGAPGIEIDKQNSQGDTALTIAIGWNRDALATLLIDKGASITLQNGRTNSTIYLICKAGNLSLLKTILGKEIPPALLTGGLAAAAAYGHLDMVELMMEAKCPLDLISNQLGLTPLMAACDGGHYAIAKRLIEAGAPLSSTDLNHGTALHYASKGNYADIVELLLTSPEGLNGINAETLEGVTPAFLACGHKEIKAMKVFVKYGANLEIKAQDNKDCFDVIFMARNFDLFKWLCDSKNLMFYQKFLAYSVVYDYPEFVDFIKGKGADIDFWTGNTSPFMNACKRGNIKNVKLWLKYGCDVNKKSLNKGHTPLIFASKKGHLEVVKLLVEKGAKINETNNRDETALYQACLKGKEEVAEFLIDCGADPNKNSLIGCNPLQFTILQLLPSATIKLIEHGALIEKARTVNSPTAIHTLFSDVDRCLLFPEATTKIALYLIQKMDLESLSLKDSLDVAPLNYAALLGNVEVVKCLLDKGVDVNVKIQGMVTPFNTACDTSNIPLIHLFLSYKPKIEASSVRLFTAPEPTLQAIFEYMKPSFMNFFPEEIQRQLQLFTQYTEITSFVSNELPPNIALGFWPLFPHKAFITTIHKRLGTEKYIEFLTTNKLYENLFYEVDKEHFNLAPSTEIEMTEEMSKKVASWELTKFLELFELINFDDNEKAYYFNPNKLFDQGLPTTKENLKRGLEELLKRIKEKTVLTGTPKEGTKELDDYYSDLVILLKQLGIKIEEMAPDERATALVDIATLGLHCGNTIAEAYRMLSIYYGQLPKGIQDTFYKDLQIYRENIIVSWSSQTHFYTHFMYLLGKELNLPNAKAEFFSKPDKLTKIVATPDEIMEKFLACYNPTELVEFALKSFWSYYSTNRDETIELFKTHTPSFWKKEFYSKLLLELEGKNASEIQKHCLNNGVILDPEINELQEAVEHHRCCDYFAENVLEMDENFVPIGIKRSAIRHLLYSLKVLKLT